MARLKKSRATHADVTRHSGSPVSPEKAKKILEDGTVRGHPLTKKQRGFFGLIAGGGSPSRKKGFKG